MIGAADTVSLPSVSICFLIGDSRKEQGLHGCWEGMLKGLTLASPLQDYIPARNEEPLQSTTHILDVNS